MIYFASIYSRYDRKVYNVIHELGHAFSSRLGGLPATMVESYSAEVDGKPWKINSRPDGFYQNDDSSEKTTWQYNSTVSGTEVFADMFLGWVMGSCADGNYGDARAKFMQDNMNIWIQQAKGTH